YETQIHWWDAATGERRRRVTGHDVAVQELCAGRDGQQIASAGADRTLRLWGGANGQAQRTIQVGVPQVAVALSPDGKQVAGGGFDGLVRLYDPAAGRLQATLAGDAAEWAAVAADGYVSGSRPAAGSYSRTSPSK